VTRVILFDIDGTLVLTGGAGMRAMGRAFEDVFSIPDAFANIRMPGRTDAGILSDAAVAHGIPTDSSELERFRSVYFAHLRIELHQPGPRKGVMPGVRSLLETLAGRGDVYLALLTGNYEESARDQWPLRREATMPMRSAPLERTSCWTTLPTLSTCSKP
jgi:phosphoglycolate phosphatase